MQVKGLEAHELHDNHSKQHIRRRMVPEGQGQPFVPNVAFKKDVVFSLVFHAASLAFLPVAHNFL